MNQGKTVSNQKDPLYKQAIARLVQLKQKNGTLSNERKAHTCSPATCQPESEEMLLQGPAPLTSNVYVCRFGSVHLCTQDTCNLYHTAQGNTCPISGFQFGIEVSSYSKHDFRTWRNPNAEQQATGINGGGGGAMQWLLGKEAPPPSFTPPLPVKRKRKKRAYSKQMSDEDAQSAAGKMVHLLLYSKHRHACIERARARFAQQAENAKTTYIKTQLEAGQLPFASDMYRLVAHFMSQPLPMKEYEFNANTHNYYVFVITQVWDVVQRFHVPLAEKRYEDDVEIVPRLDFDAIALGVMYLMRKGMQKGNTVLLPADNFLLFNLPSINALSEFSIEKSMVTKGDKIITDAYENAFVEGAALSEVVLDMDKMPVPETTTIVQSGAISVKLSSSGEKLFMPKSRRNLSSAKKKK